jgi:hypothetical protein
MNETKARFESPATRHEDASRWARSFDGWLSSRIRTFARERRHEESSRAQKPSARFERQRTNRARDSG